MFQWVCNELYRRIQAGNYLNLISNLFLEGKIVKKKLHFFHMYEFISCVCEILIPPRIKHLID
jgi:hypothetical protein